MLEKTAVAAFRLSVLLVAAWGIFCTARAQDVSLRDAIQCKDFKRTADGNWQAQDASVTYGSKTNQQQLNLFGSTTIRKGAPIGGVDLWTILNDKCGTRQ